MSRILGAVAMGGAGGQDHAEGRAAIGLGLEFQQPAVVFDDARGNGQAQSGAGFLGREKWIKQSFLHFGWYAFAVVFRFQNNDRPILSADAGRTVPRAQNDSAM